MSLVKVRSQSTEALAVIGNLRMEVSRLTSLLKAAGVTAIKRWEEEEEEGL